MRATLPPAASTSSAGVLPRKDTRIASLDGLRAISIGLVLLGHASGTAGSFLPAGIAYHLAIGDLGVRVFFVISGFLITTLLMEETERTGSISLGQFYLRRTCRIFPPYYAFLLVLIVLDSGQWITLAPGDVFHAFTYTSNYHNDRSWNVGHTWSLSVEEQFYLLWPAALLILRRAGGLRLATAFVVAAPILRIVLWTFVPAVKDTVSTRFETVADAIAIGCILALVRGTIHRVALYRALLASRWLLVAPPIIVLAGLLAERPRFDYLVGFTLRNVLIGVCLDWCITHPNGRVGRLLNRQPFVFVGLISYSLYLWQQIFLNRHVETLATTFPLNLALAGGAAVASYYLVERPVLTLRRWLEVRLFVRRPATVPGNSPCDA